MQAEGIKIGVNLGLRAEGRQTDQEDGPIVSMGAQIDELPGNPLEWDDQIH
jgi:hypothetical protein